MLLFFKFLRKNTATLNIFREKENTLPQLQLPCVKMYLFFNHSLMSFIVVGFNTDCYLYECMEKYYLIYFLFLIGKSTLSTTMSVFNVCTLFCVNCKLSF